MPVSELYRAHLLHLEAMEREAIRKGLEFRAWPELGEPEREAFSDAEVQMMTEALHTCIRPLRLDVLSVLNARVSRRNRSRYLNKGGVRK